MKKYYIFKISLFLLFFSGFTLYCGKKGPLRLEPEILPLKVTDFKVTQTGENIKLKWAFPPTLSDGKSVFRTDNIKKVYIYYSKREVPALKFKRRSDLLLKISRNDLRSTDSIFRVEIPFDYKKLDKITHYFGLYYVYNKKKSQMSDIVKLSSFIPVKPISDLKIVNERKVNKLTWSRGLLDVLNNKVDSINGYNLYRKVISNDSPNEDKFILLNKSRIVKEYYEDRDIGKDGTYSYYISTIQSPGVFSKDSNTVSVSVKDLFPPDIPENLTVFKGNDFLVLSWENVRDKDLAFYRIFRRSGNSGQFSLTADKIEKNRYKDKNVKKGNKYFYYIISVDLNGNESDNSRISYEEF
ncbi:MAG: hypothetical protein ABFR75_01470 [Acidobacteriota bacterium]